MQSHETSSLFIWTNGSSRWLHCVQTFYFIYAESVTNCYAAGNPQSSNKTGSRAFTSCYWFLIITVLAIYSGNLVAFSTMRKLKLPVKSIEELAANSDYQAGVLRAVSTASLYKVWS